MDLNYLDKARTQWRTFRWNTEAVECYQRNCICDGCYIKKQYPNVQCKMKEYVLEVYKRKGKP